MTHRPRTTRAAAGALAAALLSAALTACNGTDDGPSSGDDTTDPSTSSSAPSDPPSTTPTPMTEEERVTAALEHYLEYRDNTYRAPDTFRLKDLAKVSTGEDYLNFQARVLDLANLDIVVTGEYGHALDDPRRRGATYLVRDCENRADIVEKKDGDLVPPPVGPDGEELPTSLPVEYALVKQHGKWLVSKYDVRWQERC